MGWGVSDLIRRSAKAYPHRQRIAVLSCLAERGRHALARPTLHRRDARTQPDSADSLSGGRQCRSFSPLYLAAGALLVGAISLGPRHSVAKLGAQGSQTPPG